MLFVVPGRGETVRVNGTARIVTGAAYLPQLAVQGVTPDLAVEVRVEELFLHCSKAFLRSALWEPDSWLPEDALPTGGQIARSQSGTRIPASVIDAALRHDARVNRY